MKNVKLIICLVAAVLFMTDGQGFGVTEFKDGGTHNISSTINDNVWVDYQTPGMQTTVNLLNGGYIDSLTTFQDSRTSIADGTVNYYLTTRDNSQLTMSGGWLSGDLNSYDSSHVTMSNGYAGSLTTYDGSHAAVSGGTVNYYLATRGSSQLTMSGGWLSGDLNAYDSSHIIMTDGYAGSLTAYDGSYVTMSGGTVNYYLAARGNSQLTMSDGGLSGDLKTYDSSHVAMSGGTIGGEIALSQLATLIIDGSGFAIDGIPVGAGGITSILGGSFDNDPYRRLTGTLANGDVFNNQFRIGDSASIVLVPEPATLLLLGGGLCLVRRFRRQGHGE